MPLGLQDVSVPPATSSLVAADTLELGGGRDAEHPRLRAGVPGSFECSRGEEIYNRSNFFFLGESDGFNKSVCTIHIYIFF